MAENTFHDLNESLIVLLRNMAMRGAKPSEVLTHLRIHIQGQDEFIAYLIASFLEDGDLRMVGFRWWHGDISERAVNIILKDVFERCITKWKTDLDSNSHCDSALVF